MNSNEKKRLISNLNSMSCFGFDYIDKINISKQKEEFKSEHICHNIDELNNLVMNCHLCSLGNTRKNTLFGLGDTNADVMFIIETSNFDDEKENKIISGDNFNMLKNMIEKVLNIDINSVYITNILKCATNAKLDNLQEEVQTCINYLKQQIRFIKPKLIVTLGSSYKYILDTTKTIDEIIGKTQSYDNIDLVPLYSTSHLARNPSLKQKTLEDLNKINLIMDKF